MKPEPLNKKTIQIVAVVTVNGKKMAVYGIMNSNLESNRVAQKC